MSIFSGMKKVAKFTAVTVPLSVIGWNYNKRMFGWLRSFVTRSVNPPCPMCERGVMVCVKTLGEAPSLHHEGPALYPWGCSDCNYGLLEIDNVAHVRKVVTRMRFARAKETFNQFQLEERLRFASRHRVASRIFFAVASLVAINCIRLIVTGESIMMSLNWASFTLMFWVFGMKRSYRSWQVAEGHLFQQGAFWYWFKNASWLI